MIVAARHPGIFESQVEPGATVQAGDRLGWLLVAEHCAQLELRAPHAGRIAWLRPPVLSEVEAGEPLVAIGEDEAALSDCRVAERRAALRQMGRLEQRLRARQPGSDLGRQLVAAENAEILEVLRRLRQLVG